MLDLYANENYKDSIRSKLKELQQRRRDLNLRKIAQAVPLQYTYLSKVLNNSKTHLNEDHLFKICKILEIMPEEMEFLSLQRSRDIAIDQSRKDYLSAKIESLRKARKLNVDIKTFSADQMHIQMKYLLNPLCVLVHMSLCIKTFRQNPALLCSKFGITGLQLVEILNILEESQFIELGEKEFEIKSLVPSKFHFGKEHPLMRVHQTLLKTSIQSHLARTEERDKLSILATFTMDRAGFDKVKEEFQVFLKKIEEIASRAKDEQVYQLSFDLFKWV